MQCLRKEVWGKEMLSFWQLRVGVFDRFNLENHRSSVNYVSRCIQEIPYGISLYAMSNIFNGFYNLKDIRGRHGANKAKKFFFYFKSDFDSLSSLDSIWNFLNASGNIFNWGEHIPMNIAAKLGSNWPSGFGED
jgi:hypothetical protein